MPFADVGEASCHGHDLTGWSRGHVRVGERVRDRSVLPWKLIESVEQPAWLREQPCFGVMRDQRGKPHRCAGPDEMERAVKRMKARIDQQWGVADVVQPGRGDQQAPVGRRDSGRDLVCLGRHRRRVCPTGWQRCQEQVGDRPGGGDRRVEPVRWRRDGAAVPVAVAGEIGAGVGHRVLRVRGSRRRPGRSLGAGFWATASCRAWERYARPGSSHHPTGRLILAASVPAEKIISRSRYSYLQML